ncbi:MAG: MBL fold metallo-hydrolase [Oscillospiraceae bacterium]|nr:MBL fold metallo-hydrolase [Oscillospiraceae bacterium]
MSNKLSTPWKGYIPPFRIWGNLYFVGTKFVSNHLIDTGDGLILLDTGYAETLYMVLDNIYQLGFDPRDIKYIVHSHGHIDHIAGTCALVEMTGAKTFLGRGDLDYVTGKRDLTWAAELGMTFTQTFTPDVLLDDADEIKLGNTTIKCYHTPGHTEGCTSFVFNVTDGSRTLIAGTHGGVGLNSLAGKSLKHYDLPLSLQQDFLDGIDRLSKLHVDICFGNHPETVQTEEKGARIRSGETDAFVDPEAWPEFLARRRKLASDLYAKEQAENT